MVEKLTNVIVIINYINMIILNNYKLLHKISGTRINVPLCCEKISLPYGEFHFKFCIILFFIFLFSTFGCDNGNYNTESPSLPPIVTFTEPAIDSANVSTDSEISASFDQAIDLTTITTSSFILQTGNVNVPGTISYSNKKIVFIPDNDLNPNTSYTATITTGVKNLSGISLENNFKWNFTTGAAYHYEMTERSNAVTDSERDGTKIMQMGDYLYSYGGWTAGGNVYNDVYRSNGDLSTWTKMTNASWHGRHTFGIAKLDSTLYVFGGDLYNKTFDVWSSADGIKWEEKNDGSNNFLGSRILYGACAHNGMLYVLGGQAEDDSSHGLFADVWSSVDGINWLQIAKTKLF
jgi:hypothetical protein